MASKNVVNFTHHGNFNKFEKFLTKAIGFKPVVRKILDKYGRKGVEALKEATPKDTGLTSESWTYEIVEEEKNGRLKIVWRNTNVQDGQLIAILLQYGHATENGGYVQGQDYINPAIDRIFNKLAQEAWKEVSYGRGY